MMSCVVFVILFICMCMCMCMVWYGTCMSNLLAGIPEEGFCGVSCVVPPNRPTCLMIEKVYRVDNTFHEEKAQNTIHI